MHAEEFDCSISSCGITITAERKQNCFFLDKITTRRTLVCLRREFTGVALGSGNLGRRAEQYHGAAT